MFEFSIINALEKQIGINKEKKKKEKWFSISVASFKALFKFSGN